MSVIPVRSEDPHCTLAIRKTSANQRPEWLHRAKPAAGVSCFMGKWVSHVFCAIVAVLVVFAFSPRGAQREHGEPLNLTRLQINDLIRAGDALVAVGERGTIIKSLDDAQSWNIRHDDRDLPVTLTALAALSDEVLLATGHDGVILRSPDAGEHWSLVRHDGTLGEPLLGVLSADGRTAYAWGSFGKFLISTDAGLSWTEQPLAPVQGEHLNGMDGVADGVQMLVGEMGLALRSVDGGRQWQRLDAFYNGSLFGISRLSGGHWAAYGMRGHVFVSADDGDHWEQIALPHQLPLYGHVRSGRGELVIVGTGGAFVRLDGEGRLLESGFFQGVGTLTSVVELHGGGLFVAGQSGLTQGARVSGLAED